MTTKQTKNGQKQTITDRNKNQKNKPRYKWNQIRLLFLESEYGSVAKFLKKEYGINTSSNSYARTRTKGWGAEKKVITDKAKDQAKNEVEKEIGEKLVENYKVPVKQLNSMKKTGFDLLFAFLSGQTSKIVSQTNPDTGKKEIITTGELDLQKIIRVLDKTKIEMGEPVSITEKQLGDEEKQLEKDKIKAITKVSII